MNNKFWLSLFLLLTAAGSVGAVAVLTQGHSVLGTGQYVTWGILISTYIFFVVTSTGLCLVSSLGHVFGLEKFVPIGKRAILLAIITLLAGFIIMGLELGNPLRLLYVLVSPGLSSAIFWMGALYGLYLILLVVEFYYLHRGDNKKAQISGLLGFLSAITAHSNLGAIFGFLHSRPYWEGPYIPIYFILSALLSGTAILIVMFYLKEQKNGRSSGIVFTLSKLLLLFIGITMFFTAWKFLTGLYGHVPGKYQAIQAMLKGPLSGYFWGFEVLLGMILPFVLLIWNRTEKVAFWASSMALIGIFFMRYNLVIAGQIVPMEVIHSVIPPAGWAYYSYTPTLVEWAIVALGFGLTGLSYLWCERRLPLDHNHNHKEAHAMRTREVVRS